MQAYLLISKMCFPHERKQEILRASGGLRYDKIRELLRVSEAGQAYLKRSRDRRNRVMWSDEYDAYVTVFEGEVPDDYNTENGEDSGFPSYPAQDNDDEEDEESDLDDEDWFYGLWTIDETDEFETEHSCYLGEDEDEDNCEDTTSDWVHAILRADVLEDISPDTEKEWINDYYDAAEQMYAFAVQYRKARRRVDALRKARRFYPVRGIEAYARKGIRQRRLRPPS